MARDNGPHLSTQLQHLPLDAKGPFSVVLVIL